MNTIDTVACKPCRTTLVNREVALQFLVRHNVMTASRLAAFMNQLTATRLSTANAKLLLHVGSTLPLAAGEPRSQLRS